MSREEFENATNPDHFSARSYNFGYRVNETNYVGEPTTPFVSLLSFKEHHLMNRFGGSSKGKPGVKIDANNVWLSAEQVDELITALMYWRQTYGQV